MQGCFFFSLTRAFKTNGQEFSNFLSTWLDFNTVTIHMLKIIVLLRLVGCISMYCLWNIWLRVFSSVWISCCIFWEWIFSTCFTLWITLMFVLIWFVRLASVSDRHWLACPHSWPTFGCHIDATRCTVEYWSYMQIT